MTATPPLGRITLPLVQGITQVPINLPAGSANLLDLLPSAWQAAELATNDAIQEQTQLGKKVSCKPHCGACCRQLVSISIPEAVRLAEYVAEQPAERQAMLRAKFAAIVKKLEEVGMLDKSEPPGARALVPSKGVKEEDAADDLAVRYFLLQMPCPFLEDESCGIYAIRPSICREYHVTSPSELCARVYEAQTPIERIVPKFRTGVALMETAHQVAGVVKGHVPLGMALEWASSVALAIKAPKPAEQLANTLTQVSQTQTDRLSRGENVSAPTTDTDGSTTANIELGIGSKRLKFSVTVPNGPTSPRSLIPLAMALTDLSVEEGTVAAKKNGETVSCTKGCAACCRHLAPVAETEARQLASLVAQMPEPRRAEVEQRFATAKEKLAAAGILNDLQQYVPWPDGTRNRLAEPYFAAKIDCPFLENEMCSIYADRPAACREHLVTSPAVNCSTPFQAEVKLLELPTPSPFRSLARASSGVAVQDPVPWVPLVLALDYAKANPEPVPSRAGPAVLRDLFNHMTGANRG